MKKLTKLDVLLDDYLREECGTREQFWKIIWDANERAGTGGPIGLGALKEKGNKKVVDFFERRGLVVVFSYVECDCGRTNLNRGYLKEVICDFCELPVDPEKVLDWKIGIKLRVEPPFLEYFKRCGCGEFTNNKTDRCRECTSKAMMGYREKHEAIVKRITKHFRGLDYRVLNERCYIDVLALKPDKKRALWEEIISVEVKHTNSSSCFAKALKQIEENSAYCDGACLAMPSFTEKQLEKLRQCGIGAIATEDSITLLSKPSTKKAPIIGNSWSLQMILRDHKIRGRSKAYGSRDAMLKMIIDEFGKELAVDKLRAYAWASMASFHSYYPWSKRSKFLRE